jgi:membrane-bound metal-dependent hydrolase YbcI (DUF457 family)
MDVFSHALWGGAVLGRKKRGDFLYAAGFSVLPDLLGEGVMFSLAALGLEGMPTWEHGHPDIGDFPVYAQRFYDASHSLLVFAFVFLLVWLLRRKAFLPLAAWGIHILIDIPTHSAELFPTPFLWPLSDFKVDGIMWDSPAVMIPNFVLLAALYGCWFYRLRQRAKRGKAGS